MVFGTVAALPAGKHRGLQVLGKIWGHPGCHVLSLVSAPALLTLLHLCLAAASKHFSLHPQHGLAASVGAGAACGVRGLPVLLSSCLCCAGGEHHPWGVYPAIGEVRHQQ